MDLQWWWVDLELWLVDAATFGGPAPILVPIGLVGGGLGILALRRLFAPAAPTVVVAAGAVGARRGRLDVVVAVISLSAAILRWLGP